MQRSNMQLRATKNWLDSSIGKAMERQSSIEFESAVQII